VKAIINDTRCKLSGRGQTERFIFWSLAGHGERVKFHYEVEPPPFPGASPRRQRLENAGPKPEDHGRCASTKKDRSYFKPVSEVN
jgi:hypothetical protein